MRLIDGLMTILINGLGTVEYCVYRVRGRRGGSDYLRIIFRLGIGGKLIFLLGRAESGCPKYCVLWCVKYEVCTGQCSRISSEIVKNVKKVCKGSKVV